MVPSFVVQHGLHEWPQQQAVVRRDEMQRPAHHRESDQRPVVEGTAGADKFPKPADLFDITKFGGWDKVNTDFFDPEKGVVAKIFQSQGKSTESG